MANSLLQLSMNCLVDVVYVAVSFIVDFVVVVVLLVLLVFVLS